MRRKGARFGIIAAVFVLIALLITGCASPEVNPYEQGMVDGSYTIDRITMAVAVNDDGTVDFTERYDVTFHYPHRGIYRDLPTNSGEAYRNIEINESTSPWHSVEHYDSGLLRISLGVSDDDPELPSGTKTYYELSYTMLLPEMEQADRLMLNLVGFGWNTSVKSVDITLTTPAGLRDVSLYHRYGSDAESSKASISGSQGSYKITASNLSAFEGITLVSGFEGDFTLKAADRGTVAVEIILAVIMIIAAVAIAWWANSNDDVTPITNYYPPRDGDRQLSPADIGLIIDGTLSASDITSMIFYWASKGYIEIDGADTDDPVLIHKRDLDRHEFSAVYVDMFDKIFATSGHVRVSELTYKLNSSFNAAVAMSHNKAAKFYDKKAGTVGFIAIIAGILVLMGYSLIKAIPVCLDSALVAIPTAVVCIITAVMAKILWRHKYKLKAYKAAVIFACIVGLALSLVTALFMYRDVITYPQFALIAIGAVALCLGGGFCGRKSGKYKVILGEVLGFKHFLEVAEKEKLEMLLSDDPQYYYDILPYTNVLGVSDKWEDKFKDMTLEPPRYFTSSYVNAYIIHRSLYRAFDRNMAQAFASKKASGSSRSGFGGSFGGFGGGGFGGGGGGAR